jgi:hypothetical protein
LAALGIDDVGGMSAAPPLAEDDVLREDYMLRMNVVRRVLAASFLFCGTANAQDWKVTGTFGWLGVGKAYEIEKGHQFWVGEFSGSFTSDKGKGSPLDATGWKCPSVNDIDGNNRKNKANGYCIIADTNGDQAYISWQCEGDIATCTGTFDYSGGTGKYRGINGHNTFVGHIQVNWPDGASSGYSTINR